MVSVPFGDRIENSIIRELSDGNTVSYIETASDHWIVFASTGVPVVEKLQLPTSLFLLDMYVFGEQVYFCGTDIQTARGVWGWFDNNAANMASNGLTLYSGFQCSGYDVDSLKSLVVYSRGTNLFSALVGSSENSQGDQRACTVSISGSAGIPTGWSYGIGISSDTAERMTKTCLTDSYVVATGVSHSNYRSEMYRIHNRYNMWDGQADRRYYFPWGGVDNSDHYWDPFALTHLGGDTIATASPFKSL